MIISSDFTNCCCFGFFVILMILKSLLIILIELEGKINQKALII